MFHTGEVSRFSTRIESFGTPPGPLPPKLTMFTFLSPEVASTLPSPSVVAVGYHRP